MKTQIIQLIQNEDTISVRDKMSWSRTGRILLVWPVEGRILIRKFDLNLVNRHAESIGAQLGLVTQDSEVIFYAQQMGIPVFRNLRNAENHTWKDGQPIKINLSQYSQQQKLNEFRKLIHPLTPSKTKNPVMRLSLFGISLCAIFILGIFILPSSKIILTPRVEIQSLRFELYADPSSSTINLSTGNLPIYRKEVIVEGSDAITATGSMSIPDDPALSELKFTNVSKQAINIPAGTIVATFDTYPVRFITIPIGDITIDPGKSIVVPARAIKPGLSGNLPPNKLVVIEGNLGMKLTVTNPDATKGGSDATFPSPTIQDLQSLREKLIRQLKETALYELQSILPDEDTLISPTILISETLEETPTPSVGEPGNELELSMRLLFQAQVVSSVEVHNLVTPILNSNTPDGYSPIMNSLEIIQLNQPSLVLDGRAHWTVIARRQLKVVIQAYQTIDLVKGATITKAKENLSASLPLMNQAQIELAPAWWPRLPFLAMRIQVTQADIP